MIVDWLERVEQRLAEGDEEELATALVSLAFFAASEIRLPEDERRSASRRTLLLLVTGGDPARGLDLGGRAVTALAADLDTPERRSELLAGLGRLLRSSAGLPHVSEAMRGLVRDPEIAWRAYAAAILAEDLDDSA